MNRAFVRTLAAGFALGCAGLGWGLAETHMFAIRRFDLPILPIGHEPIRVLHISDAHLLAGQRHKLRFIESLGSLEPDLVVNTGDNIAFPNALPRLIRALEPLRGIPGVFVFGSNDYYGPKPKNPFTYLFSPTTRHEAEEEHRSLPWQELRASFEDLGWTDVIHKKVVLKVAGRLLAFRGTDDAHLNLDEYPLVAGPGPAEAVVQIGVTHAPYLRLLDAMTADGMDLILAGHTHGGQVCVPFKGALVTNCDLEPARVKGLSTHSFGGRTSFLEVSAGIGAAPFAPVRVACRPEVTLLTLTSGPG